MENEEIVRVAKLWLGEDGIVRIIHVPGAEVTLADCKDYSTVPRGRTAGKGPRVIELIYPPLRQTPAFAANESPFLKARLAWTMKPPTSAGGRRSTLMPD